MYSYLLDAGLQVLHEELPQVVQRLQLLGHRLLESLQVLLCLLAPLELQRHFRQPRALLRLVTSQPFVVVR